MPFTLAHPAAAVPLARALGHRAVLSALVIGTMVPDFWRFMPFEIRRADSHSVAGFFWFCLPVGLLVYLVYHLLMKRPLLDLLPRHVAMRIAGCGAAAAGLPRAGALAVLASLALGALTHLAWDAVTHTGAVVDAVPLLQVRLFRIGGYESYAYSLLQHLSTAAGLVLVAWWARKALARAPMHEVPPPRVSPRARSLVLWGIALAAVAICAGALAAALESRTGLAGTRELARAALGRLGLAALGALLAYGAAWHLVSGNAARP